MPVFEKYLQATLGGMLLGGFAGGLFMNRLTGGFYHEMGGSLTVLGFTLLGAVVGMVAGGALGGAYAAWFLNRPGNRRWRSLLTALGGMLAGGLLGWAGGQLAALVLFGAVKAVVGRGSVSAVFFIVLLLVTTVVGPVVGSIWAAVRVARSLAAQHQE
jgi:hypothetical protein